MCPQTRVNLSNSNDFFNKLVKRACHDIKGNIATASGFVKLLRTALNQSAVGTSQTQDEYLNIIGQEHAQALIDLNTLSRYASYIESATEAAVLIGPDEFKALITQAQQQCQKKTQSVLGDLSHLNLPSVLTSRKALRFALTELFYHLFRAKVNDNASQNIMPLENSAWTIELSQQSASATNNLEFLIQGNVEEIGHNLSLMLAHELLAQYNIDTRTRFESIDIEGGGTIKSLIITLTFPRDDSQARC